MHSSHCPTLLVAPASLDLSQRLRTHLESLISLVQEFHAQSPTLVATFAFEKKWPSRCVGPGVRSSSTPTTTPNRPSRIAPLASRGNAKRIADATSRRTPSTRSSVPSRFDAASTNAWNPGNPASGRWSCDSAWSPGGRHLRWPNGSVGGRPSMSKTRCGLYCRPSTACPGP